MRKPSDKEAGAPQTPDLFAGLLEPQGAGGQPGQQSASPFQRTAEETISFIMKLRQQGFRDTALARAFELAPRERFAAPRLADLARKDYALPMPCGQVMTAPLVLARMYAALELGRSHRVLEIGAGSGYGTALLSHCVAEVVSVERFRTLCAAATARLAGLAIANAAIIHADGLADDLAEHLGLAGEGGFDRIILNGAVAAWPLAVITLLRTGGRAIGAIGSGAAGILTLLENAGTGEMVQNSLGPLSMPPLRIGLAQSL